MAYIKLYFAEDDTEVSEEGTFVNAVEFELRADLEESGQVRLYAMAEPGYTVGNDDEYADEGTTVEPVSAQGASNPTMDKWQLAPDVETEPGVFEEPGASLFLGEVAEGAGGRIYFWAKALSSDTETPVNDTTVVLKVEGVARAV